jgi:hypothetical protein
MKKENSKFPKFKMKKLQKEQLEELKRNLSVIKGIYIACSKRLAIDKEVRVEDLRRYNIYLNRIREITGDNEFINFSVLVKKKWNNDDMVDGSEFNSKINQFFEYIKTASNLNGNKKRNEKLVYYTNPFWLLWKLLVVIWQHKIISFIFFIIGLLATDYAMAWKNVKTIWNFIKLFF